MANNPDGVALDLETIVAKIGSATNRWDASEQEGLAIAYIANQAAAISGTLHKLVGKPSGAPEPGKDAVPYDALNIAAHINSGTIGAIVAIDKVSEAVLHELDERLSKAGKAAVELWGQVDRRLTVFSTNLDGSIGRAASDMDLRLREVVEQLACICRGARSWAP